MASAIRVAIMVWPERLKADALSVTAGCSSTRRKPVARIIATGNSAFIGARRKKLPR